MIYAIIRINNSEPTASLYYRRQNLYTATFSPLSDFCAVLEFKTHGKTYKDRKESARDLARDFLRYDREYSGAGLSWGEYAEISAYFQTLAKRYGLTEEFTENGLI